MLSCFMLVNLEGTLRLMDKGTHNDYYDLAPFMFISQHKRLDMSLHLLFLLKCKP